MTHTPYAELDYLIGRSLTPLSQSYIWNPLLRADTNPNLGEDGEALGSFVINGLLVTAWCRFRWNGADADGGSGAMLLSMPIEPDRDFMVINNINDYANRVGIGQAFNADNLVNSFIIMAQFIDSDPGVRFVRSGTNSSLTGPNIVDSDGDAFSMMFHYVADHNALHTFLGFGGDE